MSFTLPDSTQLGASRLLVKNLALETSFYEEVLGFQKISATKTSVCFGQDGQTILELVQDSHLTYAAKGSAGLYHNAFLYSSSGDLARTLYRFFQIAPNLYQGAGDHLVSMAFYMSDPEGNGIELYLDRPKETWPRKNGVIQMDAQPIDIESFISEHGQNQTKGTISLGHIHLKVGTIKKARQFYVDTLGFEVVIEHPTALFVAAGGYHHHIGLNTWESLKAPKRVPSLGLDQFTVTLPAIPTELQNQLDQAGIIEDPWGTKIKFQAS